MATTTRQTSLLVSEDWTKLYQTFRNADFQSYDYETIRKTMIDYLRTYYPEDFNDFIESSEFIALIDLVAYLGQSLSFRGDLNARENFIDTAQRRDSILKLAKLISYSPKRNINSSGLLKIDSVSTSENVFDSDGVNLSNLVINWADAGNENWLEQFNTVLNASFVTNQVVGKPSNSQLINGITNSEYQINLVQTALARYAFKNLINGTNMDFEAISPTSAGTSQVYEVAPRPNATFNLLQKNDNRGNFSVNTGFFVYFKEGVLQTIDVNFQESIPNRVYPINVNNINNNDIWVYQVNSDGTLGNLWEQVPSIGNTNVIYNKQNNKNVYQVNTRANDQIDLVFGDGSFSKVPQGKFRIYYRTSNGLDYKITPTEMQGIIIPINYISKNNRVETITIRASLQYTVANASSRESIEEIRQKAPQQYYTQDRMISAEDYNILPYTLYSNILKIKAVNRTSSGVSRYLDVVDNTGKYSSTNIFAQDGMLYSEETLKTFSFDYTTVSDIQRVIYNQLTPIIELKETQQFFYENFQKISLVDHYWNSSTLLTNGSTGYFYDLNNKPIQIGSFVSNNAQYITEGAIVKFSPGDGKYFDNKNKIQTGTPSKPGDKFFIYAAIEDVLADGTNSGQGNLSTGKGPVTITQEVPTGAIASEIYAVFNINLLDSLITNMISYIQAFEDFALRYDITASEWKIIKPSDVSSKTKFDLTYEGDVSGTQLDQSWIIKFETVGETYIVHYRGLQYAFESVQETNFYFDDQVKVFDPVTGNTIYDQVKVLKINTKPDSSEQLGLDYSWYIYKNIVEADGYENPNKILVTFPDSDNDGIPDNPELFKLIVNPEVNTRTKYVFFQNTFGYDNFVVQTPVSNNLIESQYSSLKDAQAEATLYKNNQLFYIDTVNKFYKLTITGETYTLSAVTGYTAKKGRQDIYFQYRHNSPNYRRIDPSPNNIIDLYVLTKQYVEDYTAWIKDTSNTLIEPTPPTSEDLSLEFSNLENYKSVSDTIIYNPAVFKPIFGSKSNLSLQATFKVVKNPNVVVSDTDVQSSVVAAINRYFDIENWDFGETFYFSELAAYLHSVLTPTISSIIIVPASENSSYGSLQQINANFNEIIVSSATVENVQIISAITAAQLNQTISA